MLHREDVALLFVDVQGKLADVMFERDELFRNLERLLQGCRVLGIPVLWFEQNPEKMGPTVPALAALIADAEPLAKMSFSCCRAPGFAQAWRRLGRRAALLAGIETHVCIYQTAAQLVAQGVAVQVAADAVSSRTARNRDIGLQRIGQAGGTMTSVESFLFEMMDDANDPAFRDILRIVR